MEKQQITFPTKSFWEMGPLKFQTFTNVFKHFSKFPVVDLTGTIFKNHHIT